MTPFVTSLASSTTTSTRLTSNHSTRSTLFVLSRTYGSVPRHLRALTATVCFTESDLDYDVIHPSSDTYGICGIKLAIWSQEIPQITRTNVNTLYAGSLVINFLLQKHHNNIALAIKEFKGSTTNKKPVHKVLSIYHNLPHK